MFSLFVSQVLGEKRAVDWWLSAACVRVCPHAQVVDVLDGANEAHELLALKNMGIGSPSHRGSAPRRDGPARSPTSVSSPLKE